MTGFSPFNVGFLQRFLRSKFPKAASVKSAFSTSASVKLYYAVMKNIFVSHNQIRKIHEMWNYFYLTTYLVPVNTVFLKMVPLKLLPVKLALSTMAFEKSAPSKLESDYNIKTETQEISEYNHLFNSHHKFPPSKLISPYHVDIPC